MRGISLPSVDRPYPFRLMQYARLLFLRGELLDGAFLEDREATHQFGEHHGVVWVGPDRRTFTSRPLDPR